MMGIPHPASTIAMAEEHRAELLAVAERDARARSAQTAERQPQRGRLSLAVATAAALLLALGVAAAREQPEGADAGPGAAEAPLVTQAGDELLLDPDAAREMFAARL